MWAVLTRGEKESQWFLAAESVPVSSEQRGFEVIGCSDKLVIDL